MKTAVMILDEVIYSFDNNQHNLSNKNINLIHHKCLIYPYNFLSNIKWSRTEEAMLKKLDFICEQTREKAYANWSASNWSYWNATMVIPNFLFIGDRSSAIDIDYLKKRNITYLLNCAGAKCTEGVEYDSNIFTIHMFEAKDNNKCQILNNHLNESIQFIEKAKRNKQHILVHCVGGVNRSATIVTAYLMYSKYKKNVFEASKFLINKRTSVLRNKAFKKQLVEYEIYLHTQQIKSKKKSD
eukprot:328872_1